MEEFDNDSERWLKDFDTQAGTNTARIRETALLISPRLSEVYILPVYDDPQPTTPEIHFPDSNAMAVLFGAVLSGYSDFIHGYLQQRFDILHAFLGLRGKKMDEAAVLEFCIAHELGHAHEMLGYRDRYGDKAIDKYYADNEAEYWNLPLAVPTSTAFEYWQNNTGGYRKAMERYGYNEGSFKEKMTENVRAYGKTACEAAADNFALQVFNCL